MKLWEKIYIGTLLLFLIILNLCMCIAFYISYNNSLKTEKETTYGQWTNATGAFRADYTAMTKNNFQSEASIAVLFQQFATQYHKNGLTLEMWTSNSILQMSKAIEDGMDIQVPPDYSYQEDNELYDSKVSSTYYDLLMNAGIYPRIIVMEYGGEKHIVVAGKLVVNDSTYIFVVNKQLTGFKELWINMIKTFALIEFLASIILAIFLYFFLRKILTPLGRLSKAADAMANGDLHQMVDVMGKDEIALVAGSFNHMSLKINESMQVLSEEADRKQEFIDNLAHEIRTPLTTIQGYSQLLQRVVLPEEKRVEYLSYIIHESKRISLMSEELLKLALIKREELSFEWFENEIFLKHVVESLREMAGDKGIVILTETDRKRLYGNQTLLNNLLVNLIKNAINASDEGGEIAVGVYVNKITVRDHGIGMSEECLENIFEPFYREDKARSRSTFGAGLGMTICKQIIDKHQGRISITSKVQKGTLVEVFLPAENLTAS